MPPWLLGLLPSIVETVKGAFGVEDAATKNARIQSETTQNIKQGDVDIAQAKVNEVVAANSPWQGLWRSLLAFSLVADIIVRYPLTTLTQFVYSILGMTYNRPVYSSDELIIQLIFGLLGLGLMYFRSQDKKAAIASAVTATVKELVKPKAEAGVTNQTVDGKKVRQDNNGERYVYRD